MMLNVPDMPLGSNWAWIPWKPPPYVEPFSAGMRFYRASNAHQRLLFVTLMVTVSFSGDQFGVLVEYFVDYQDYHHRYHHHHYGLLAILLLVNTLW